MGIPTGFELLLLSAIILLFIPLYLFLLSLAYAYVTSLLLPYFKQESQPIKALWKKYLLVVILSALVIYIIDYFITLQEVYEEEEFEIIDLLFIPLQIFIETLLVYKLIKNNAQQSIGLKASLSIVILYYLFFILISIPFSYLGELELYPSFDDNITEMYDLNDTDEEYEYEDEDEGDEEDI